LRDSFLPKAPLTPLLRNRDSVSNPNIPHGSVGERGLALDQGRRKKFTIREDLAEFI
jgi:hypothetical protein